MKTPATQLQRPTAACRIILAVIVILGAVLRFVALDKVPPGLAPDEATNGYDAYSLMLTGRDQHGATLPLVVRSFNDYRMPLFIYSLIPIIRVLGLTVTAVRLGAALWGVLTIVVTFRLGYRMANTGTGLVAALFLALSPWHLTFSRIGLEISLAAFAFALSIALLWEWRVQHRRVWLVSAGLVLGATIYTYSTAKLLVPALVALLGIGWFRAWREHGTEAVLTLALVLLLALPMLYLTLQDSGPMQARYEQIAVFRSGRPWLEAGREAVQLFARHFSPGYLFIRGDLDALQHPPYGGQLYWVQAPLLLLALTRLRDPRARPALVFLLGWLVLAAIPPALTVPNLPGSAHASRNLIAVVPFQILTALGVDVLWQSCARNRITKAMVPAILGLALGLNAIWYGQKYFFDYAPRVAHRFAGGMQAVIQTMDALDDGVPLVVFSDRVSWPYIYVLFFTRYDPARLHLDPPVRTEELFAPVTRLGKYVVVEDLEQAYADAEQGLFIGPPDMLRDAPDAVLIERPSSGEVFCKIVRK